MDFHSMKRKQLQALCKKHRIPANLSNLEMANRLTEIHKEGENPVMQPVIEEHEESVRENESKDVVLSKKCKKVRFSPDHELIEFTREPVMKSRTRRNSVYHRESNCSVEIAESGETKNETEGRQGRTSRTGELKLMEVEIKQKKRGIKAVKCNDGRKVASVVESFDDEELEEGDVVKSERVTRLRGKMAAEVVKNGSKRERKGAKGDDIRDEKEHAQKLTEAHAVEEKRVRTVGKNKGKVAALIAEIVDNVVSSTESLSKRVDSGEEKSAMGSDQIMKGNRKVLKEILMNKQIAGEHGTVEPQLPLRRSKRGAKMVAESEMLTDVRKHENDEVKGSRKTSKWLASDGSEGDAENSRIDVNPGGKEPIQKIEPRRSNRRKTMIQSGDLRGDTENGYTLRRKTVIQSDMVSEVCKDDRAVMQPMRVMKRSRRNARDTDVTVENLDAEKHISESPLLEKENGAAQKNTRSRRNTSKCGPLDKMGEDSNIHQKNKVMKELNGHVSGEDGIKSYYDPKSGIESLKGSSSKKVLSAPATRQSADERKQPRLGKSDMLDASSHHGSTRIKESLMLDVQLSTSKDSESANNLCSENIISGVELTSITETNTKEEDASIADIADSSCMDLINGEDLANSDTNAASKSAALEVEKGKLLLEVDVVESIVQNITDVDNHDPEAQVFSPTEGSVCGTKINDQVLEEGLDVEKEGSSRTHSSAQCFLHGDQTDSKTDMKVAKAKADEHVQPCLRDDNSKDTSQTSEKEGVFQSCNISGAELTFITETHTKKEEASIADSADSSCMHLINGENLVNSETDAACKRAELEVEKGNSLLEVDVEESVEQNIADVDKNDPEAQVYSPIVDSGCITKINDQVLAEGLDVGEEDPPEPRSSALSFFNAEIKVAETEVSGCLRPCLRHNNSDDASQTSGKDGVFESCETRHHGDNVAEGNEIFFANGRASELAEAEDDGCLKDHSYPSDHFSELNVPDLSNGERDSRIVSRDRGNIPDECSVMHIAEHCYQAVDPIPICSNSTDVDLKRGYEEDQMTQKEDRCINEGINSEVSETRESESSKGHKSKCDEDGEFNLAKLFNEEGRYEITPLEKEHFSGEHSDKDFTEQVMSHSFPSTAPTTMCNTGDHEENLSAEETHEADESECMKIDNSSNSQETSSSTPSSVSKTQDYFSSAEQQERLSVKSNALANADQRQGAWSNASELAENAVCFLKSPEGKTSHVAEGLCADEDDYGIDKEASAEASIPVSDIKSCFSSKIVTESIDDVKFQDIVEIEVQHENLLARQTESDAGEEATHATSRQSWTETELQKLFGTSDEDAPSGLGDTFCQGSETKNMTMSMNNSTARNSGSLAKKQQKEIEGVSSYDSAKTKDKNMVLPSGYDADIYEHDLKCLFATPVKNMTPFKAEESNLSMSASLSDNGGNDICEGINKVESFELLNTSTGVLSGAGRDSCEALEDQLIQNNIISTSGSPQDLFEPESCVDMSETRCKSEDHTKAELSDADLLKSGVPDNSYHDCTFDGNILEEALVETSSDPEVAKITSSKKDVTAKEHGSSVVNLKDENTSTKTFDVEKSVFSLSGDNDKKDSEEATHATSRQSWTETELQKLFGTSEEDAPSGLGATFLQGSKTKNTTMSKNNSTATNSDSLAKKQLKEMEVDSSYESAKTKDKNMVLPSGYDADIYEHDLKCLFATPVKNMTPFKAEENNLSMSASLSDNGGNYICEGINEVESFELPNTSTSVLSGAVHDSCEALEDQLVQNNIICTSGSPQDLNEPESCVDMSESRKSEDQTKAELSDADLQESGVPDNRHPDCTLDGNNLEEASVETSSDPEVAKISSSEKDVTLKGTYLLLSPKTSPVRDELIQSTDTVDLDRAKICVEIDAEEKSSQDISDEFHANREVAIMESLSACDNQVEEAGNIIALAEHVSSFVNLKDENTSTKTFDVEKSVFNLSGDNDKKDNEKAEENSTAEMPQYSIQELRFEENAEDFKNDTHAISNLPASGINEILKESDVADTIKEYIESESSLSVIFENSSANLSSDMLANTDETFACENSGMSIDENDIAENDNVPPVDCLDAEIKVDEGAELLTRPAQDSENAPISPEHHDFFDEGATVKLESQKKIEFKDGQSSSSQDMRSTMRTNARTIMILGTPGKLQNMADMKENEPYQKRSNVGDITAARPAKRRRALQNIQGK